MEIEITHSFDTPTPHRNDINVTLRKSGIYHKPIFINEIDSPMDDAISIGQKYGNESVRSISIPIDQIDNFCKELQVFAKKVKTIIEADKQ